MTQDLGAGFPQAALWVVGGEGLEQLAVDGQCAKQIALQRQELGAKNGDTRFTRCQGLRPLEKVCNLGQVVVLLAFHEQGCEVHVWANVLGREA